MTRVRNTKPRCTGGVRRCAVACAAAVGILLALCALYGAVTSCGAYGQDDVAVDSISGVQRAYADDQNTAASPAASPSATSNKPDTSPSPSGNASKVDELDSNTINSAQLPDSSFLYDTSIAALTGADSYFDNQIVQVTGEAVGDAIRSGLSNKYRWITLASTAVNENETLSVYMSEDFAKLVDGFGKYGRTGTILQVRGTFHLACSEHDGVTDLHAENVSVVKTSESHPDAFEWGAFIPGLVLVLLGLIALRGFSHVRERLR